MYTLLRWIAEWAGRRRGAQVIVFDGAAEVERARAFLRGVCVGGGAVLVAGILTAPMAADPALHEEVARREGLVREAERRVDEAVSITRACLATAQTMKETLDGYRDLLEGYPGAREGRR